MRIYLNVGRTSRRVGARLLSRRKKLTLEMWRLGIAHTTLWFFITYTLTRS
jgi:hypothetical protein